MKHFQLHTYISTSCIYIFISCIWQHSTINKIKILQLLWCWSKWNFGHEFLRIKSKCIFSEHSSILVNTGLPKYIHCTGSYCSHARREFHFFTRGNIIQKWCRCSITAVHRCINGVADTLARVTLRWPFHTVALQLKEIYVDRSGWRSFSPHHVQSLVCNLHRTISQAL